MAWKKRKKQNNIKAKVIDVEARIIPDVEETLMEEEPIISETEELKLNQAIVTDILKESAEQSFKDAWEANETVAENTEPVVEEVRKTVTETADNAETTFEEVMKTVEDTAEDSNNAKPEVDDAEARDIPDVEEALKEEPRLTETEELKLNQSIVSDILKESAKQSFEVAEEAAEVVTENAESVAEEVRDTAEVISNEVSLDPAEEENFREETAEETAEPAEQTAETSEEYTDETIVYDGAGSLTIADPGETREVSTFDGDSVEKSDSMAKGKKEKKAKKVKVKKDRLGFNWFFWLSS
jgi:hypothetical protein